jgi:hypothetical protein
MRGVILIDQYDLEIPEFRKMYIGDAKTPKDFDAKKAIDGLGSGIQVIADVDSTHSGTRVNTRCYPAAELRKALRTWTQPYPRPFLSRHPSRGLFTSDDEPDVLGRVQGGKFIALADDLKGDWINPPLRAKGSGYVLNSVLFSGRDTVEKIVDKRLLTVSVGMKSDSMVCPICLHDWVPSMLKDGVPPEECEHRPGNVYEVDARHYQGKMPFYHVARKITFDHIADTFRPAQPYASILGFKIVDDSLRDVAAGESLSAEMGGLALCDEAGHIVRFSEPVAGEYSPPLTETDALVLASMEDAKVLDVMGEFADGLDTVALRTAIDRVRSSGKYEGWKREAKGGKRLGLRGAMPVMTDEFAEASMKFIDRYTGADKDTLGLKLFATPRPTLPAPSQPMDGGNNMTPEQIEKLSTEIFAKMGDLKDDTVCNDAFLKECLDADLFEKVSFASLTEEQLATLQAEDRELEIDGIAEGIIDKALTAAARKRLPDSAFCGPNRSFPVHDESHIRNALSGIEKVKGLSAEQKARTRACIVAKAKKAGIEVGGKSGDTSATDKVAEEKIAVLEREKADLQGNNTRLANELKSAAEERDELFDKLQTSLVNQLFDLRVQLGKADVKSLDDEGKTAYLEKLGRRTLDSLEDALSDLRVETQPETPAEPADDPNQLQDGQDQDIDNPAPEDDAGDDGNNEAPSSNVDKIKRGFNS